MEFETAAIDLIAYSESECKFTPMEFQICSFYVISEP